MPEVKNIFLTFFAPFFRHEIKPLEPVEPEEYPATWPYLFIASACPQLSPGSSGIRRRPPVGVRTNGTIDLAVFAAPATSPASLIPEAERDSPRPRLPKFVGRKLP